MDVVAGQAGFENAVATLGTACTAEHVQKLFRFTESVVFSFDGDAAGRRAATRARGEPAACERHAHDPLPVPAARARPGLVRARAWPRRVRELHRAGGASVAPAAGSSRRRLRPQKRLVGRARLVAQARPLIDQLPDGMLRGQIVDALGTQAHVPADELRRQFAAAHATGAARAASRSTRPPSPLSPPGGSLCRTTPFAASAALADGQLARSGGLAGEPRTDLWEQLGNEAHALLTQQPAPHGEFFLVASIV